MNQLDNILKNIDEKQLKRLIIKIKETHEYDVLKEKTQIKNSAVEDKVHDGNLTNRQKHTYQVSQVAHKMVQESGMSEKEALVAELVGLCHDLGHTPFGHDGEMMFAEKTGKPFYHAKYGAKIFDKIFNEILDSKNNKTGKEIFDKETKENFEGLRNYIKAGVNFHQDCYYIFKLDKNLEQTSNKEQELLEMAIKNPCIQAGMLADTVAFMQSDVRDLLSAKNPFDSSKTVISIDDQMEVAQKIDFSKENIEEMQKQLMTIGQVVDISGLEENDALKKILETVGNTSLMQIQKLMAINIGKQGLNKDGRFESISDEYKLLLDNNENGYKEFIEFKGIQKNIKEWNEFRNDELANQRKNLMQKNPLLCLTYEIQDELMYGRILNKENIKILNNDVERNRTIFSRTYDYLEKVTSTNSSELTVDDIEVKKQMMKLYKEENYPKQFKEKHKDGSISKKEIVKNLIIFKMQQMGNQELKDFYQEKIASKEKSIEVEIDILEQEGKTDNEIIDSLTGIDIDNYEKFKQEDEETREKVARFQSQTEQEIASEFNVEKRDIDEIQAGKTPLSRNLEYNMTYNEIEQVNENIGKTELESKSDMASFEWSDSMSEGEGFEVDMETLVRNALGYMNITTEDVVKAERTEDLIRNQDKEKEGVSQR